MAITDEISKTIFSRNHIYILVFYLYYATAFSSVGSTANIGENAISYCTISSTMTSTVPSEKRKQPAMLSSFWYAREEPLSEEALKEDYSGTINVPYDHYLDGSGPLCASAYRPIPSLLQSRNENIGFRANDKQPCLITPSFNIRQNSDLDADEAAQCLHAYIDHGFNSFQIIDEDDDEIAASSGIYSSLRRQTPKSILDSCLFTSRISSQSDAWDPVIFREKISQSLIKTGGDYLDIVQLQYDKNSPYVLEIMDSLLDLQREGLVLSVSGLDLPTEVISNVCADISPYLLDYNQFSCNVIDQSRLQKYQSLSRDHQCKMLISDPLLGGLLANEYLHNLREPSLPKLNFGRRKGLKTIRAWAKQMEENYWYAYRTRALGALHRIAAKYEVEISDVVMRWNLELDGVGSIVDDALFRGGEDRFLEPRRLRNAFTFSLDEDDRRIVKELAQLGTTGIKDAGMNFEDAASFLLENQSLWL